MKINHIEEINNLIEEDLKNIDKEIYKYLDSEVALVNEATTYIFQSGGKRLRPVLLILSSYLLDYKDPRIYTIASIIEYIHTATLLHDDIIDGAKYRRGRISTNNKFGSDISVLCGDFLYSRAFINLVRDGDPDIQMILAEAAKTMSEGEIFQLVKTADFNISIDDYLKIIHCKTAVLMSACCEVAAIFGKSNKERIILKELGELIGLIFQMNDDVLDFLGDSDKTGKKPGTDLKEGKMTLPLILLRDKSDITSKKTLEDILLQKDHCDKDLEVVIELLHKFNIKEDCYKFINRYIVNAKKLLEKLPQNIYSSCLSFIIEYAALREN
jgi:octaprenyl-diphosphate synthase